MAELHVTVDANIDGALVATAVTTTTIPPDYDAADIAALAVRQVEVTAFRATRDAYGRAPTMQALIAAAARLKAIEDLLPDIPDATTRAEIREIIEVSNEEATTRWGEDPEGN